MLAAVLVFALAPQVKQVVGSKFIAILTTDGSVFGIGNDIYGMQVRPNWEKAMVVVPAKMTLPSGITQIAVGDGVAYALLKDGTVRAWGRNDSGQLGDGKPVSGFTTRLSPEPVAGLNDIVQIDACDQHAIALRKDGKVFTWGWNHNGVSGNVNLGEKAVKMIEGLNDIKKVDTGYSHALALGKDGSVYAWGENNNGQVGIGKYSEPVPTPTKVNGIPKAIDIAAGDTASGLSSVVTTDGRVFVWGSNTSGLLGNGQKPGAHVEPGGILSSPTQVKGVANAKNISLGAGHQVVLHANGTLTTWGFDGYGQLALGKSGDYSLKPSKPKISGVATVYASGYNTFAIKQDGSLWWSGMNTGARRGPMKDNAKSFTKLAIGTN